jgi:hypothetical protein
MLHKYLLRVLDKLGIDGSGKLILLLGSVDTTAESSPQKTRVLKPFA